MCTPPSKVPRFPLVSSVLGIWATPPEMIRTPARVATPVPLDLVSLQEGFFPGPLTPIFKRIPATSILPVGFLCVFCVVYSVEPLFETIRRTEDYSARLLT